MAYSQAIINGETGASGVTKLNDYMARIIYPEDYGAVGDGVADDAAELDDYFTQLSSGSNTSQGSSKKAIYLTSTAKTISSLPYIKFPGTITRTTDSVATSIVTMALGAAGYTEIDLNVDGNVDNANAVTGFILNSGNGNGKAKHTLSARYCDTAVYLTGNIEKQQLDIFAQVCTTGFHVHNDGSPNTPDEISARITGGGIDVLFLSSGTEKTSGQIHFNCEGAIGSSSYSVEHQNGSWTYKGEMRGRPGGFHFSTTSALSADLDVLMFAQGGGSPLYALLADAGNLDLTGKMVLNGDWDAGCWVKEVNSASLKIVKMDGGSSGTGLKIGEFSSGKDVVGFILEQGSILFGSTNALELDYSIGGTFNFATVDAGGILIGANSSGNRILIPHSMREKSIVNNRTQLDNTFIYQGVYTNAELEQINAGAFIKGMRVEASADTSVYGSLFWNGSNWKSENGLTYNTGTNTWS